MDRRIYYVDGVCGSGKTQAMLELVNKLEQCGGKTIIAQPSKALIGETRKGLNGRVETYTADIYAGEVSKRLTVGLSANGLSQDGCTVLTTHHTVLNAPTGQHRRHWHLFVDEIPSVDKALYINIGTTNKLIMPMLEAFDIGDNLCLGLCMAARSKETWTSWKYAKTNESLIASQSLRDLAELLLSPNYDVLVDRASWQTAEHNNWQLRIHAVLKPEVLDGWASVRIMGANFKRSMFYQLWQQAGVEFVECPDLKGLPTKHNEQTSERVRVHYFSARTWSKYLRNKAGERPFDGLVHQCNELFKGAAHLWVANNDIADDAWAGAQGTRISNVAHGLNQYKDVNNIVFLSALNDLPAHYGFLERRYGVSGLALKAAKSYETLYQCVMRTSLRVDGQATVNVVVPDKEHADFLCTQMFPQAKQFALDGICKDWGEAQAVRGRPIKTDKMTSSERVMRSRKKQEDFWLTKKTIIQALKVNHSEDAIAITWQPSTYSSSSAMQHAKATNWDEVRQLMHEAHNLDYRCKEDNSLLNMCSFQVDPTHDTYKGRQNIIYVSGIMLDFDGGLLLPNCASKLFSDFKHMVFNSYNNGKDGDCKFRVFIPFDLPCQADLAEGIWDALAERIRSGGWYVGRNPSQSKLPHSGLDVSKRSANSFYYLPCKAALGKKHTFLIDNWDAPLFDTAQAIKWLPHDSTEFAFSGPVANHNKELRNLVAALSKPSAEMHEREVAQRKKELAADCVVRYHQANLNGVRRNMFFKYVLRMHRYGVDDASILAAMRDMDMDGNRRKQASYHNWLKDAKAWKRS